MFAAPWTVQQVMAHCHGQGHRGSPGAGGYAGLLVKAHSDARGFFSSSGMTPFPVRYPDRDYPHRFWLPLG